MSGTPLCDGKRCVRLASEVALRAELVRKLTRPLRVANRALGWCPRPVRRAHLLRPATPNHPSGFGYELTFRLKKGTESTAPLWPATFMNTLARYVHKSGSLLRPGDFIPHILPGDLMDGVENCILTVDPQLPGIRTQNG